MRLASLLVVLVVSCLAMPAAQAEIQPNNPFPRVRMVTSMGDIVVELNRIKAPLTVANFLQYVEIGSYDNTVFHRIIPEFVVQGGGFDKDFNLKPERPPVVNESGNGLANVRGTIAMARSSDPHSATRQFYFNVADNASLDPSSRRWGYAVFGWVVEGDEVLQNMAALATTPYHDITGYPDVPIEPPVLIRIDVLPPQ
ncbi:MAG: Peptidyl-prolyl cis-trans isomerase A [Pseudidiomarina mangrovi]|nr:MAG: Peptidyl-prolyl cis-trans isomerase A [Pseudidiomarina mangrovi]